MFKMIYQPRKQGQKPNALTRMPGDILLKGGGRKNQPNFAENRQSRRQSKKGFDHAIHRNGELN
jgi:hypothetical protein